MQTPVTKKPTHALVEGYVWIPVAAISHFEDLRCDLYILREGNQSPALFHGSSLAIGPEQLAQIKQHGHEELLIRKDSLQTVSSALSPSLDKILKDSTQGFAERFGLLQIATWHRLEHDARKHYWDRFVETAQVVGKKIAELLHDAPVSANGIYDCGLKCSGTATHLTYVSAYCVLLAHEVGIKDPDQLERIATGAMLHDIGMLFLPQDLVHKPGRLTPEERQQIERYPQLGYEQLCERPDLDFGQLMMVYQHQERFDGCGYPVGVENDEIHPWARILAVANVFDAMTSERPYRRKISSADALLYLADNASQHFDPKAVLCWITIFQQP